MLKYLPLLLFVFAPGASAMESYIQVDSDCQSGMITLQTAVHTLVPPDSSRPVVKLVGVIHIGTPDYYNALQPLLDSCECVLFECVDKVEVDQPSISADYDAVLRSNSDKMYRFAAGMGQIYQKQGRWPNIDELLKQCEADKDFFSLRLLRQSRLNHRGQPFRTEGSNVIDPSGVSGSFSACPFTTPSPEQENIIKDIAHLTELTPQGNAIRYDRPHFQWCDLTFQEIYETAQTHQMSTEESDKVRSAEAMMRGDSAEFYFLKSAIFLLNSFSVGKEQIKRQLITLLAKEGEKNAAQENLLIIDARNDHIIAQLNRLPYGLKSVAVFYGAAHMADIEEKLCRAGYRCTDSQWFNAIACTQRSSEITLSPSSDRHAQLSDNKTKASDTEPLSTEKNPEESGLEPRSPDKP